MIGIMDFLKYKSLSALAVSPDGRRAVIAVSQPALETNDYRKELWLCGMDGSKPRRLLEHGAFMGESLWMNESSLGFLAPDVGDGTAWRALDVDTGECRTIIALPKGAMAAWPLPDGAFAFLKVERLVKNDYPEALAFLEDHDAGFEILDEIPAYFNGEGFISGRRRSLYVVKPGQAPVKVTVDETNVDRVVRRPDGLFFAARTYRGQNTEPGVYFLENGAVMPKRIVPEGLYRIHDWAVDERGGVVFAAHDKRVHIMSDDPAFYRADADGVTRLDLPELSVGDSTSHDCVYGENPSFAARDGAVWCVTTREHDSVVVKGVPGEGFEAVTPGGYSVTAFELMPDGNPLLIAMGPDSLQELYRCSGGALERLTDFSAGALDPGDVLKAEKFTFVSHGFNVNYVVLKPAGFDPARRYPAILYIHGGAKICYTDVFFHEMQFLASSGYFVIYGNPRGSDGQGSEFARLLGHYGEPDYEDIMLAMDEALRRYPNIDPERLGVAGGSYGGIMTNWVVTHTDRFRAAVAQRSICSMLSTFGTADNGYNFVREQMGGDLWDAFDDLWRQSPLKYAKNCHTPLLLIHSDEDYRCHYSEAMQMFTALKYLGVEAQVCLIHGENHSLSRCGRPAQRVKRLYEIVKWFDRHLAEAGE